MDLGIRHSRLQPFIPASVRFVLNKMSRRALDQGQPLESLLDEYHD